jgi:ferrous iron transport protein B
LPWFFKKTLLKGASPILILELPPYRRPAISVLAAHVWERAVLFLKKAGTIILGINILLWFLVTYPKDTAQEQEYSSRRAALIRDAMSPGLSPPAPTPDQAALLTELDRTETGERLRRSFAGRLGRLLEPAIAPLGMDWKIGIGLVTSFAAREVFVSTMSTVYSVGSAGSMDSNPRGLVRTMREQKRPDGSPLYTPLMGLTLMVFYVLAMQCVSTMAVVQRETNSWKWPLFQWLYMGGLAWTSAFLVYQGGRLLGWR